MDDAQAQKTTPLFGIIPKEFFTPLASPNRLVYWDCLCRLFQAMSAQLSFGIEREILVDELQFYFEQNQAAEFEEDDINGMDSRKKANEMRGRVGTQGAGKSTFFRFLAIKVEWFSDDLRDLGDKKIYEKLRGHWIMEMSEMIAAISAKSNEEIKSFLSRQKDTFRNSYGKFEEDRPRQCLKAGTTTTQQFSSCASLESS